MLTIKVWCLPGDLSEEVLKALHKKLVSTIVGIQFLTKIKDENDLLILFPKDMMQYGLGNEILVEYGGADELEGPNDMWRNVVGDRLARIVKAMFPKARVFLQPNLSSVYERK